MALGQTCAVMGEPDDTMGTPLASSGNLLIDQRTQQVYLYLSTKFGITASLYFLEEADGPNAFASPKRTNVLGKDGTIYLGIALLNDECSETPDCGSIPILLAHEFGHLVAYKYKVVLDGKQNELFADYLAGTLMFHYVREMGVIDLNAVARSFYAKGDDEFHEEQSHGSPTDRQECLLAGFDTAQEYFNRGQFFTLPLAIKEASEYVEGM